MLIRLPPQQLQLGMFVDRIEGSWLSHPFWKGRFRLDDPADLESLRASDVPGVWVNPELGRRRDVDRHTSRARAVGHSRTGAGGCRARRKTDTSGKIDAPPRDEARMRLS